MDSEGSASQVTGEPFESVGFVVEDELVGINGAPSLCRARMISPMIPQMEPEQVASVILYLTTEAPDAMTGAAIDVFG